MGGGLIAIDRVEAGRENGGMSTLQHRIGVTLVGLLMTSLASAAERAKLPEIAVPGALGVNIHFTQPRAGEMKMLAEAGFKWVRMDFSWGGTERERGKYDFGAYDGLLKELEPYGIRAIFILDYSNRLYDGGVSPHTNEGRAAMAAWAVEAVKHFARKGVVWEMWNEPNIKQFWKPKPSADDYAKLALAVGKAVKGASPDELYIGPASSTIDLKFIETCFKAGCLQYWDAVSVHPYRQKNPETVCEEYRKLRMMIARYAPKGKRVPVISGEWGFSAGWKSMDEETQGKYLAREFLTNLYNEVPISIWYDWHDDGLDPKEPEHHFGTVHEPYKQGAETVYDPKAAYLVAKTLTKELGGFAYNKRLAMEREEDWVLLFTKGEEVRLAVWTTAATPHDVTIPMSAGEVGVVELKGGEGQKIKVDSTGLKVQLTESVKYLEPTESDAALKEAAAWGRVPLEIAVHAPADVVVPGDTGVTMSGKPARVYHIEPVSEPLVAKARTGVNWSFGVEQRTTIIATNPLTVDVLPAINRKLCVRVHNPSGEAFSGAIMPRSFKGFELEGGQSKPFEFKEGQTSVELVYEVQRLEPQYEVTFSIRNEDRNGRVGNEIQSAITSKFQRVDAGGAEDWRVVADGDSQVKSEQSLSIGEGPGAFPLGKVGRAIKLTYAMGPGWKFLQVKPVSEEKRRIEGEPRRLGVWVYGDGSGNALRLRFVDSVGQTFQGSGPVIDFKGWRYVTLEMRGAGLTHWGKGDGNIHYPIRWDTMLLLDSTRERSAGEVWFAGMTLIE
jgi:hypothetical protein